MNNTLKIKATSGDKSYNFRLPKAEWMKLVEKVYDEELTYQASLKDEPMKMGGSMSGFLLAYGVTTEKDRKSQDAGNASAYPGNGDEFTADEWMTAYNHSEGRASSLESRQKKWDEKAGQLRSLNVPEAVILSAIGKRPEAKA